MTNGLLMAPLNTLEGFALTWSVTWQRSGLSLALRPSAVGDSNLVGTLATIHTRSCGPTYLDRVPPTTVPTSGTV